MNRFRTELEKIIQLEIADITTKITNNIAVKSIDDYRYMTGALATLRTVLILMEEAAKKAEER